MPSSPYTLSILFHFVLVINFSFIIAGNHHPNAPPQKELLHKACAHASYPAICFRTLSSYNGNTPRELAKAAVNISLSRTHKASNFIAQLKSRSKREQGALRDCVEQIADSVDELNKTLSELKHLRGGSDFRWQMSNAETWVSAALTNEDTCLEGFREIDGKVRSDVRRHVSNVARVTSNALYLINLLDESRG